MKTQFLYIKFGFDLTKHITQIEISFKNKLTILRQPGFNGSGRTVAYKINYQPILVTFSLLEWCIVCQQIVLYLGKIVRVITLKGKFQTLILWKCLFPVFVVPLLSMFYSGKERSWVLILLKMKLNQQTFCQLFCGEAVSSLFAPSLSSTKWGIRRTLLGDKVSKGRCLQRK